MAGLAQDAAEMLDLYIEDEGLDGLAETVEVSEELDAYQNKHAPLAR
jgi:hypothetical protein